jgi:hypothetical protein
MLSKLFFVPKGIGALLMLSVLSMMTMIANAYAAISGDTDLITI